MKRLTTLLFCLFSCIFIFYGQKDDLYIFKLKITGPSQKNWVQEVKIKKETLGVKCKDGQTYLFKNNSDSVYSRTCQNGELRNDEVLKWKVEIVDNIRYLLSFSNGKRYYAKFVKLKGKEYLRLTEFRPSIAEYNLEYFFYEQFP